MSGIAQNIGHGRPEVLARVNGMAEFVQHGAHPIMIWHDVGQNADIALAGNVGAERMRALAGLFIKITALNHVINGKPDAPDKSP